MADDGDVKKLMFSYGVVSHKYSQPPLDFFFLIFLNFISFCVESIYGRQRHTKKVRSSLSSDSNIKFKCVGLIFLFVSFSGFF